MRAGLVAPTPAGRVVGAQGKRAADRLGAQSKVMEFATQDKFIAAWMGHLPYEHLLEHFGEATLNFTPEKIATQAFPAIKALETQCKSLNGMHTAKTMFAAAA